MVSVLRSISILGSTGSVGKNTLEVLSSLSTDFSLYGISCNENILLLHKQIMQYKPKIAVITDKIKYNEFIQQHGTNINTTEIIYGDEGLNEISSQKIVNIVVAAIVGFKCLEPVINAITFNKTIIIANKEILVSAGELIISTLKKSKSKLFLLIVNIMLYFK